MATNQQGMKDTTGGWGPTINIYDPSSPYYGLAALPEYQAAYDPTMLNMTGFNKLRDEALRTGPSAWSRLSKRYQTAQKENQMEDALQKSQAQEAAAMDDLGARGGLSSGARERTAQAGMKNYLSMVQDANRQNNLNDMQIDINDETNRIQQLGQLPGMELQMIQPMVQENQRRQDYNKWKVETQNQAIANQKLAEATENSGKK